MKKSFLKWGFIILWTVGLGFFIVKTSKIDSVKINIGIKYNDEKNEIKKNEIEYKKEENKTLSV